MSVRLIVEAHTAKAVTNSLYGAVEIIPESSGVGATHSQLPVSSVGITRGDDGVRLGLTLDEDSREEEASSEVPKSNCWLRSLLRSVDSFWL
jgi:hypothetical protein